MSQSFSPSVMSPSENAFSSAKSSCTTAVSPDLHPEVSSERVMSAEVLSTFSVEVLSRFFVLQLSAAIPDVFQEPFRAMMDESFEYALSSSGHAILGKTRHFIDFVRHYAKVTMAEMVHVVLLVVRIITIEKTKKQVGPSSIVNEEHLGTLLLCACILATKMNRDVPCQTGWWAKIFGLPLSIVRNSEVALLAKLEYRLCIEKEEFDLALAIINQESQTKPASN